MTTERVIVFRPQVDQLQDERTKRFYAGRQLVDYGDHVEWTDGKRTWKWRLPDQANGPAEYPVLAAILFVPVKNALGLNVKMNRVAFIAADGQLLTHLSTRVPVLPQDLTDKILPDQAYVELERRGVKRLREEYRTLRDLYQAHPDPSLNRFALSFALHPVRWISAAMLVIIVVVNVVLLLTGYYS